MAMKRVFHFTCTSKNRLYYIRWIHIFPKVTWRESVRQWRHTIINVCSCYFKGFSFSWRHTVLFSRVRKIAKNRLITSSCLSVCRLCLSVRPSFRPHGTPRLPLNGFYEISYLSIFQKSVEKIEILLTFEENKWYFTPRPMYNFVTFHSVLLRMRNVSDKSCIENQNTFLCPITLFLESHCLWDTVEEHCRAVHATDGNMAHADCRLHTYGYKCTLRIYNTYCLSIATMVARTRLNATLHVHCLPC